MTCILALIISLASAPVLAAEVPAGVPPGGVQTALCDVIRMPEGRLAGARAGVLEVGAGTGEVEIRQYGGPEDMGTFQNSGFKAVRFDPPFDPPYTILQIRFPTFTTNGVPAVFPSVRLCEVDPATGTPKVAVPMFQVSPYIGSSDGMNVVPLDLTITEPNKTLYWCVEFPSAATPTFPNDYPFLRMDYKDLERGLFANSYDLTLAGRGILLTDRNLIVSMVCRPSSPNEVPIESSSNLGANSVAAGTRFSFQRPRDMAADGMALKKHSLRQTDLLWRTPFGPWTYFASVGPGLDWMASEEIPNTTLLWSSQAVDKAGNRAILSNTTMTGTRAPGGGGGYDTDEPNGRLTEAANMPLPVSYKEETYFPAGEQDFYDFDARVGDFVHVSAAPQFTDGNNDLDLALTLYDHRGRIVASTECDDDESVAKLTYAVQGEGRQADADLTRRLSLQVSDTYGSRCFGGMRAPRVLGPGERIYLLTITTSSNADGVAASTSRQHSDAISFKRLTTRRNSTQVEFEYIVTLSPASVPAGLRIYDVRGRLVRHLAGSGEDGGRRRVVWDERDSAGRRVPSGIYFVRLDDGSTRHNLTLRIVR